LLDIRGQIFISGGIVISRNDKLPLGLVAGILLGSVPVAFAQSPYFDDGPVVAACSASGDFHHEREARGESSRRGSDERGRRAEDRGRMSCLKTVQASLSQVRAQGLPEDLYNSQLGQLAAVLLATVQKAEDSTQNARTVARALRVLSRFSTDERQRRSLLRLARLVARGEVDLFDLELPFAASPS
jgi:hypothetical protein